MGTMTIRLEDHQEEKIEQLKAHYDVNTKNKAIGEIIDNHLNLINQLNEEKAQRKKLHYMLENIRTSYKRKVETENEWIKLMQDF